MIVKILICLFFGLPAFYNLFSVYQGVGSDGSIKKNKLIMAAVQKLFLTIFIFIIPLLLLVTFFEK